MVCQNCKSREIVSIQGQSYCINCGQLVPKTVVGSAPDRPVKIKPVKTTQSSPANEVKQEDSKKVPTGAAAIKVKPLTSQVITKHSASFRIPVMSPGGKPSTKQATRLSDIKPQKTTAQNRELVLPAAPRQLAVEAHVATTGLTHHHDSSPKPTPEVIQRNETAAVSKQNIVHQALKLAVASLRQSNLRRLALVYAFIVSVPLSLALNLWLVSAFAPGLLRLNPEVFSLDLGLSNLANSDLGPAQGLLLALAGLWLVYLSFGWLFRLWVENFLVYGASKQADNRTAAKEGWLGAAWQSLGPTLILSGWLTSISLMGVMVTLMVALKMDILFQSSNLWFVLGLVLLGLMAYITVAGSIVRILAQRAVVLGGLGVAKASKLALELLLHGFGTIAVAGGISLILSGLIGLATLGLTIAILLVAPQLNLDSFWLPVAYWLAATPLLMLAFLFSQVYWLGIYRGLVRQQKPSTMASLLAGRQSAPVHSRQIWGLTSLTIGAVIIAYLLTSTGQRYL